jgi:hypothetical protein
VALAVLFAGPLEELAAATTPDIVLFAQVTPQAPRRGDTVHLDVESLQGASFVDLDNLSARVILYDGTNLTLTFAPNGTGRYFASFGLPLEVQRIDYANIIVEGYLTGKRGAVQVWVTAADMPHFVSPGLMIFGTMYSDGPLPHHYAPGDRLHFRVWTYLNGTLQDVGTPIGSGYLRPHNLPNGAFLTSLGTNTTRVGTGTFDIVSDLPTDIQMTNEGYISAGVPNMTATYGSAYAFQVDPFPAVAVFEVPPGQAGDLRVCAAQGGGPLPNASVTVDLNYDTSSNGHPVTRGFVTGEDGCGLVGLEWPSNDTYHIGAVVTITFGGLTTYLAPQQRRYREQSLTVPVFGLPGDFQVELVGDPGDVPPGGEARLSFAVTQAGSPYANGTIGVVESWWRGDRTQVPVLVANLTTDSLGLLNLSYSVPAAWSAGLDFFSISLYTPEGDEAPFNFGFGPYPGYPTLPEHEAGLTVAAAEDVKNGTMHVHAAYNGDQNISGWMAAVFVIPNGTQFCCFTGTRGDFPTANVPLNGTSFDADLVLPPWLWEGDFQVFVMPYTFGRSLIQDRTLGFENSTVMHLHARPPAPAPPPPITPTATPPAGNAVLVFADENLWLLLLLAMLVGGVAAVLAATRRRSAADEEEP